MLIHPCFGLPFSFDHERKTWSSSFFLSLWPLSLPLFSIDWSDSFCIPPLGKVVSLFFFLLNEEIAIIVHTTSCVLATMHVTFLFYSIANALICCFSFLFCFSLISLRELRGNWNELEATKFRESLDPAISKKKSFLPYLCFPPFPLPLSDSDVYII